MTLPPYPRGVIAGAITSQYLLEKSRIVFQVGRALTDLCVGMRDGVEGACVVTQSLAPGQAG